MSLREAQDRLDRIAAYVKQRLEESGAWYQVPRPRIDYRWLHTLRVANLGKTLASAEGADVEAAVAGCMLHDVAVFEPGEARDHGRLGASISRPFLQELGYRAEVVENICCAVSAHVDGNPGFDHPYTLEAMVVSDADNIDRFDGYRLVETCLPYMEDLNALAEALRGRLARLETYRQQRMMETGAGHELFNQKVDLQIAVFNAILQQEANSVPPDLRAG